MIPADMAFVPPSTVQDLDLLVYCAKKLKILFHCVNGILDSVD